MGEVILNPDPLRDCLPLVFGRPEEGSLMNVRCKTRTSLGYDTPIYTDLGHRANSLQGQSENFQRHAKIRGSSNQTKPNRAMP